MLAAQPCPLPSARARAVASAATAPLPLGSSSPPLQPSSEVAQHTEDSTADSLGSPSCSGIDALLLAAQACRGGHECSDIDAAGSGAARFAHGATTLDQSLPGASPWGVCQGQQALAAAEEPDDMTHLRTLCMLRNMLELILLSRSGAGASR